MTAAASEQQKWHVSPHLFTASGFSFLLVCRNKVILPVNPSRYVLSLPSCHVTQYRMQREAQQQAVMSWFQKAKEIKLTGNQFSVRSGSSLQQTGSHRSSRCTQSRWARWVVMMMRSVWNGVCMCGASQEAFFPKLLLQDALVLVEAAVDALHSARLANPQLLTHQPDEAFVVWHQHDTTLRENSPD